MSEFDKFNNSNKSDKSDLTDCLLDESIDIIKFMDTDFPKLMKKYDITPENLGEYITTDIYGKFMLSTRFGPAMELVSQINARLRRLGITFHKPSPPFNKDDVQLIYVMEEISELSFGGGHELKTLVRIIYLIQQIIAEKNSSIKIGHIPHKVINGLFIDFPEQFANNLIKTNVGINVIDIRFDCRFSGHNIRLMKTFKTDILRIIRNEYDVIQTTVLTCDNLFKSYINCQFRDIVGIYNHFIATDEITDKTYNHIINNALLFTNVLPFKNGQSCEFHTLNAKGFHMFSASKKSKKTTSEIIITQNNEPSKDLKKKLDYLIGILNNNHINIPNQPNDFNYVMTVKNNEFDFKVPRYINNTHILLLKKDHIVEFRFYDIITKEIYITIYSEIFIKDGLVFMTNVGTIIQSIAKNKIININTIPKEILYNIILALRLYDNQCDKDQNTSVTKLFNDLIACDVLSFNTIYIILTYIKSCLGNQFLMMISESVRDQHTILPSF